MPRKYPTCMNRAWSLSACQYEATHFYSTTIYRLQNTKNLMKTYTFNDCLVRFSQICQYNSNSGYVKYSLPSNLGCLQCIRCTLPGAYILMSTLSIIPVIALDGITAAHKIQSHILMHRKKRMEASQIVYFYCLILYRLSRIQYNLSLVSMLLKFVD